ncbi:MAG: hypothetical protein ACREGF_05210 [Candidatus Saccharimonadales bacterium]
MNRLQSFFLDATAIVLFVLAALNFCGAASLSPPLTWPDPFLPLSNRWTLVLFGGAELAMSAVLLAGKSKGTKLALLAWLMTNFAVYRIGLWSNGEADFSDCLGNYVDWLTVRPKTMSYVTGALFGIMFFGSYIFLIANWISERRKKSAKSSTPVINAQPAS